MGRTEHASRLMELRNTPSFQLSEKPSFRNYSSSRSCDKSELPSAAASMPHVLLTHIPANRIPPEATGIVPPCIPGHADANYWAKKHVLMVLKACPLLGDSSASQWNAVLNSPHGCFVWSQQEQFQILDYTQRKSSSVREVLEHRSDLLLTHKRVRTPNPTGRTRQGDCLQSRLWYPQEEALCGSQDQTCQE